jgi:hypothetical protein
MKQKGRYSGLDDLRSIGKYIEKICKTYSDDGASVVGKAYFASCSQVDRKQTDIELDRQLVRVFAKNLKNIIEGSAGIDAKIEEGALDFAKTCAMPSQNYPKLSSWNSLYEESLRQCPDSGYYGVGRKLVLSSDSLIKKLGSASRQSVEDQAAITLYNHLKPL